MVVEGVAVFSLVPFDLGALLDADDPRGLIVEQRVLSLGTEEDLPVSPHHSATRCCSLSSRVLVALLLLLSSSSSSS